MGLLLHLFLISLVLPLGQVLFCSDDQCRILAFPSTLFFMGERLVNHTIAEISVIDRDTCEYRCYLDHNCVSVNFYFGRNGAEVHNCELNNSTGKEHEKDLVEATNYVYHGTKNFCAQSPCKNYGTCQSGFTRRRYRCLCPSGFSGHECETDIDECAVGVHTCLSGTATCINTIGSYNCSCNHGYEGDGRTSCFVQSVECQNPTSLTDANRKVTYSGGPLCDNSLGPNWFRFQGAAGNKMAATCVPAERCGTDATGWLNGAHPTVSEGIVTRLVCFNWSGGCCDWSINVQVRNCNGYFVYYISGTPPSHPCYLRYCGTD